MTRRFLPNKEVKSRTSLSQRREAAAKAKELKGFACASLLNWWLETEPYRQIRIYATVLVGVKDVEAYSTEDFHRL